MHLDAVADGYQPSFPVDFGTGTCSDVRVVSGVEIELWPAQTD
jgi:hypothetical protein